MRKTIAIALIILLASATLTMAVDWKGRLGMGPRGFLYSPMIKGGSFSGYSSIEPFMMGLGGDFEIKYGLSSSLVLGLSGGYWFTYDDSTAADDQSFKINSQDNASTKITVIPLSLTAQMYFIPEGSVQPYLLLGLKMDMAKYKNLQSGGSEYSATDLFGRFGAGINFWISESFAFEIGGRFSYLLTNLSNDFPSSTTGLPPTLGSIDMGDPATRPFRAVLEPGVGLTFFFGGARDTDHDGVKDKFDQCPDTPEGALVDEYGCPLDSDGDGVYDGIDRCPDTPKGAIVDIAGCPLDSDKDGVPDGIDLCPDTPLGVAVDVYGCPLDSDKDGVPDFKDQQLDTPLGAMVDENGVAIDTDGDGVPDGIDKCPDTGANVKVDEFGCPLAKPITEKITLNIKYAVGSADPDEAAKVTLDEFAERLKVYGDVKIEINGFTDALGSSRSNLKLSQKRAEAVRDYLISKGIAANRMVAKGYGEDENFFVATNDTPEGRQLNRRVEIVPIK
jgi:outer membrane protein OmpA-like peptidoglycan-associated protein